MPPPPPTAVYKCIIPIKKPFTTSGPIYHSLFRQPREGAQALPFPAWPEINDPYQPCCLPTLLRAVYFYHRTTGDEFEEIGSRVTEYWNKVVDREILQQIRAMVDSHDLSLRPVVELGGLPQLIFTPGHDEDFKMKLGNSAERVVEAIVQGVIYGNLENFHAEEEAFAYPHELAHRYAGNFYCGRVLDDLSIIAHKTIKILASEEILSRGETADLWEEFWRTNEKIHSLVQKFEPIEEIFATYMGLRFLPTEMRNTVKPMVKEALEKKNWYMAYKAFTEACDNSEEGTPHEIASFILDCVCRMIESIDINGADLLYKCSKIYIDGIDRFWAAALLEQAGVPPEVYWSVYKTYEDQAEKLEVVMNDDLYSDMKQKLLLQAYIFTPRVWLFGQYSENYIAPIAPNYVSEPDYGDNLSPRERIFYESVRQQLNKRCGFVCLGSHKGKSLSCGFTKYLQRLYERLPKEDKKHFDRPE